MKFHRLGTYSPELAQALAVVDVAAIEVKTSKRFVDPRRAIGNVKNEAMQEERGYRAPSHIMLRLAKMPLESTEALSVVSVGPESSNGA